MASTVARAQCSLCNSEDGEDNLASLVPSNEAAAGSNGEAKMGAMSNAKAHLLHSRRLQHSSFFQWLVLSRHYLWLADCSQSHARHLAFARPFEAWLRLSIGTNVARAFERRLVLRRAMHAWRCMYGVRVRGRMLTEQRLESLLSRTFYAWHQSLEARHNLTSFHFYHWYRALRVRIRIEKT